MCRYRVTVSVDGGQPVYFIVEAYSQADAEAGMRSLYPNAYVYAEPIHFLVCSAHPAVAAKEQAEAERDRLHAALETISELVAHPADLTLVDGEYKLTIDQLARDIIDAALKGTQHA